MSTSTAKPDACTECPYYDQFHATCGHELRQAIIRDLREAGQKCPVYPRVHAEAMQQLEAAID